MKRFLVVLTALLLVFAFIGCNSDSVIKPATTTKYVLDDDDVTYTLAITDSNAAAVYTPVSGDNYVLTIKEKTPPRNTYTAKGTITSIAGNLYTLGGGTTNVVMKIVDGGIDTIYSGGVIDFGDGRSWSISEDIVANEEPWFFELGDFDDVDGNNLIWAIDGTNDLETDLTAELFQRTRYLILVAKGASYGIGGLNVIAQSAPAWAWDQISPGGWTDLPFVKDVKDVFYIVVKTSAFSGWADAKNATEGKFVVQTQYAGGMDVTNGYLTNAKLKMPKEDSAAMTPLNGWGSLTVPEMDDEKATMLPEKKK